MRELVEEVAIQARRSEYVDQNSGASARLTISLMENPQQKTRMFRIADQLRLIESEATSLHARLARGAGMDETLPTYQRIQRLRRQAQTNANRSDVSAQTQPQLDRANAVLTQLAPFYAAPAPPEKKS